MNGSARPQDLLSVVVRSASIKRLAMLDEALFSLACQHWHPLEVILALQAPSAEFSAAAQALLDRQPWRDGVRTRLLPVPAQPGFDARARLLTEGARIARGEYLAFLDDDDVVYQRGYGLLIERLREWPEAVLAVGGTRLAYLDDSADGYYHVRRKQDGFFAWGTRRFDLYRDNFIPIHSYVIARSRLPDAVLQFSDRHVPLEDYEFLLRAAEVGPFDTAQRLFPTAEYRLHPGNTIWTGEQTSAEGNPALAAAREQIADSLQRIRMTMTRSEWLELQSGLPAGAIAGALPPAGQRRFLHRRADACYRLLARHPRLERALKSLYLRLRGA